MRELIKKLSELEIKVKIYSDQWGPNSPEVKALDKKIAEINAQILDFMVDNRAG